MSSGSLLILSIALSVMVSQSFASKSFHFSKPNFSRKLPEEYYCQSSPLQSRWFQNPTSDQSNVVMDAIRSTKQFPQPILHSSAPHLVLRDILFCVMKIRNYRAKPSPLRASHEC